MFTLLRLLCCILLAMPGQAQQQTEPSLGSAFTLLQSNDAAGAAVMLETITARQPSEVRAWRMLGSARMRLKQYDPAIAALQHVLELKANDPAALYNLGCAYAEKGDADHAFAWLNQSKTAHMDLSGIDADPNLAGLKSDPRFAALKPTAKDFEDPFVEPVKVIQEWAGEAANDQFGWIARNLGNGTFVTSAPTANTNAGRIYVYSAKTGKLLWKADGPATGQLGTGLESAGDTNGDGIPDVIASAPGVGKAFIYSGKDGSILKTFTAENPAADSFGRHVSGAGDVNHDGYADVIVGAPGHDGKGRAYVYSGKDGKLLTTVSGERAGDQFGSTVAGYTDKKNTFLMVGAPGAGERHTGRTFVYGDLTGKPKFVLESDSSGRAYGFMFMSVPGDVDGDGVPDLYSTDFANSAKGPSTGRAYIHSGKDGHLIHTFTGETAGEGFGIGVATAGDVNGDGHADLIIGAWQYAGAAVSGGRAYLYSGSDGRLLKTYTCRTPGDTFGFDTQAMGDVDGDGTVDFLITSAWSAIHGFHSGRVFLISSGMRR